MDLSEDLEKPQFSLRRFRSNLLGLLSIGDGVVGELFSKLISGVRWTFLFKLASALMTFGVSVLSARFLGADKYGALQFVLGALNVVLVFGSLGLGPIVVRETAAACENGKWANIKGLLLFALPASLVVTVVVSVLVSFLFLSSRSDQPIGGVFAIGIFAMSLRQAMRYPTSFLNGLQKISWLGAGNFLSDLTLLLCLLFAIIFLPTASHAPELVMSFRGLSALMGLCVLLFLSFRAARELAPRLMKVKAAYNLRSWLVAGMPLIVVAGTSVIFKNSDVVLIGIYRETADVGLYHIATRVADLVAFVHVLTLTPLSPLIARSASQGDLRPLRGLVRRTTTITSAIGLLVAAILCYFSTPILNMFGVEFVSGAIVLNVLLVNQLINVATGPVQMLLIMSGRERYAAAGPVVAAAMNIVLNILLIPPYGIVGAAIATGVSASCSSLMLFYFVRTQVWRGSKRNRKGHL